MRLIDADALRDKLHELASDVWNQMCRTFWANVYNECADMVDDQPTIEPQKWVPCSERLPDEDEDVFVYLFERPSPYIAWMNDSRWNTDEFEIDEEDEPIAWMPLPDPWKG